MQVVVDTFCSLAFAKCYSSKMPITACDLLYERVLPFYDALGVPVKAVLTDNGREFCGKPATHPYELLLAMEDIEHRNTKVRTPRTNGFVERMNRTLLDECFRGSEANPCYGLAWWLMLFRPLPHVAQPLVDGQLLLPAYPQRLLQLPSRLEDVGT